MARALPATRPAVIVEIGGGSGSAALAVGERLARDARLARVGQYVFTEIVPTFLRRAERTLRARFPELPAEFSRLDMDRDFAEQGIAPESADVVYAVNTVHIARDLGATLARIRATLKPGGVAVFSECVRPFAGQPIYVEFVFNFLENFTGVATDAETRPNHGFLTPENWRRAFRAAGFEKPEILPDVEELAKHYEAFFVAAVSARKPVLGRLPRRPRSDRVPDSRLPRLPGSGDWAPRSRPSREGSSQNGKKQYHWSGYCPT